MSDFSPSPSPAPHANGNGNGDHDHQQNGNPHAEEEEDPTVLSSMDSFFPSPPAYYKLYTPTAVANGTAPNPPRLDWVRERGSYMVFGDSWPVEEVAPTLSEMGLREMFVRGQDRSTSLQTLLKAMLLSYTQLVSALLAPPPSLVVPQLDPTTDPEKLVEHIRLISINMHFLVNELRPVQARETLRSMLRSQIETRRAKTAAVKARCAQVQTSLESLRASFPPHAPVVTSSAPTTGASAYPTAAPAMPSMSNQQSSIRDASTGIPSMSEKERQGEEARLLGEAVDRLE